MKDEYLKGADIRLQRTPRSERTGGEIGRWARGGVGSGVKSPGKNRNRCIGFIGLAKRRLLGMPGYPYRDAKLGDPFLLECRSSARSVTIAFQGLREPPNGVALKRTGSLKAGTIWPHSTSMDTSLKLC